MRKMLLCQPNVSEGRDRSVVEELVTQVESVEGVKLIHLDSDPDHNRSVLTYLGEAGGVLEATQRMAAEALRLIDMRKHQGSHPRMGALDVVPFVPVRGMTAEEAVEIVRAFGRFLGGLGVPVYYYEEAATRPERKHLPDLRRGEYETLEEKLADPAWAPDEGPATFNAKAGATATGVRFPLLAFNVNLDTADVAVAKDIARAVREKNGGLPAVRAIGLALEDKGLVQVSMNLIDYRRTGVARVLERIRSEAERRGVRVAETELIGPVPLGAVEDALRHCLQLRDFSVDQILETALID